MKAPEGFGRRAEFWLIVDEDNQAFKVGDGGLAVFSGEGEAELYRRFELGPFRGSRWQTRCVSAGELISMLYCVCKDAQVLHLDPAPGFISAGLGVWMGRRRFIELLTGEKRPPATTVTGSAATKTVA